MASSESDDSVAEEIGITEEWAEEAKKRLVAACHRLHRPGGRPRPRPPTIFRVPEKIRKCDPLAYHPQVISIGPYHRRLTSATDDVMNSLQQYKSYCVRYLLSLHRSEQVACELLNRCLVNLKALSPRIRRYYSEDDIGLTDDQLAELMLVDGCFLVRLLFIDELLPDTDGSSVESDAGDDPNADHITIDVREEMIPGQLLDKIWIWKLVKYDLLKLENQIPFFVLEELLMSLEIPLTVNLAFLASKHFSDLQPIESASFKPEDCARFVHLLHLFYSSLLLPEKQANVKPRNGEVFAFKKNKLDGNRMNNTSVSEERIPNATELQRAGLRFKRKEGALSFLDISIKSGVLEIPSLPISDHTGSLFRNLIAFEQFCPFIDTRITAYVVLMDCLVDTAQDVSILQLNGVIENRLSTGQAVADIFNNLSNNAAYTLDDNYLREVFVEVNRFHQTKWRQWIASLKRDYFENPWTTISLVAAIFLLGLTFLQAFFGVYAYYRPPKGDN